MSRTATITKLSYFVGFFLIRDRSSRWGIHSELHKSSYGDLRQLLLLYIVWGHVCLRNETAKPGDNIQQKSHSHSVTNAEVSYFISFFYGSRDKRSRRG